MSAMKWLTSLALRRDFMAPRVATSVRCPTDAEKFLQISCPVLNIGACRQCNGLDNVSVRRRTD